MVPAHWQPPSRLDALDFRCRSSLLAAAHALRQVWHPSTRRWPVAHGLADAPILAQQRSPLWVDGPADEFTLVAGKVHNLRIARPAFHAVEVPAGQVLSFWRQLGRPTAARGFVAGREVREGCVVPTLAGGICQISNALANAARRAGFELVERHAHTARPEGSAIDAGAIDATVFWNYIDLKLRAPHAWRLELELSATELVLTLRGHAPVAVDLPAPRVRHAALPGAAAALPTARTCVSCDQRDCFRHRPPAPARQQGRTALLLDGWSPEFARHLDAHHPASDAMVPVPMRLAFWRPVGAGWRLDPATTRRAWWASLRRALWQRWWARHGGGRRQASLVDGQRWLAEAHAARLKPEHTRLVVDLALLPHLEQLGVLAGRQVEVLAGALPMTLIEARLDAAAQRWPQDATLRDFRIDPVLARAEQRALAGAARVVTAHADVAAQLSARAGAPVTLLEWTLPAVAAAAVPGARAGLPLVVFPAASLARKGVLELVAALQGLACRVRVMAPPPVGAGPWRGIAFEHADWRSDWLADASAVVLPAHVEHAPRALLRALAAGVPVIATPACGLGVRPGVQLVPAGDVQALRAALVALLTHRESGPVEG